MKLDQVTALTFISSSLIKILGDPPEDVPPPLLGGITALVVKSYLQGVAKRNPNAHPALVLGELMTLIHKSEE